MKAKMLVGAVTALVASMTFIGGVNAQATRTVTAETVFISCRFDGDPAIGMVVFQLTKSAGAPPATSGNCAQAVNDYLNLGYRLQAESLGVTSTSTFHLMKP